MSAILYAALVSISLSFVNTMALIGAILVAAALIVAYMATAYKATPTIEWEAPAPAPIAVEEDFLKAIKRCKDGVFMVSFVACGKVYHRRMPNRVRGKAAYRAFILERYAHLFNPIEEPVAKPLDIGVKTPSIDSWEKMESAIDAGQGEGNGWTYKEGLLTRYRGNGSYIRAWYRRGVFRPIGDWEPKGSYDRYNWQTASC
jgi:hypothetical protein